MKIIKNHPILAYLVVAYGFSAVLWLASAAIANAQGFALYSNTTISKVFTDGFVSPLHVLAFCMFSAAVYGPLIAALLVRRATGWRATKPRRKVSLAWCAVVALIAIGIYVPSVIVIAFSGGAPWLAFPLWSLPIVFAYQVITSGMEEPGWRGFLLPALLKNHTPDTAGWLSGLAWAGWHFALVIPMYWGLGVLPMLSSLAGFTMAIIGAAFIYTWLYQRTQNLWLAILLHASMNTATFFMIGSTQNPIIAILPALTTWAIVLLLQAIDKKQLQRAKA